MAVPHDFATVQQLEAEGYFEKARGGDHRAPSLFARLVAYRLNPTGAPSSWGWLRKGGGKNVDGYSEDAIVFTADPSNLRNVVDVVAGAGASGASIRWSGAVERRADDTWEAPRPLTAEELSYLKPGAEPAPVPPVEPPAPPAPVPPPVDTELHNRIALVQTGLSFLINQIAAQRNDIEVLHRQLANTYDQLANARLEVQDVRKALERPLTLEAGGRAFGVPVNIKGTVKP
jgi:hypothetical protein